MTTLDEPKRSVLTAREMQVLVRMSYGMTNAKIGVALKLSEDTVKTHARRVFRKLNATDRASATRAGFEAGLLRAGVKPDATTTATFRGDWQELERARQVELTAAPRPTGDRHIGACYAAMSCPCRSQSTWRFPGLPSGSDGAR